MGTRYNRLIEAVLTCTHDLCFEQKNEEKKLKKFQLKIVIFTAVKNPCMLHGRFFVMCYRNVMIPWSSSASLPLAVSQWAP